MVSMLDEIVEEGKKIRLKINKSKTKMRIGKKLGTKPIKISNDLMERSTEIKEKIIIYQYSSASKRKTSKE